MRGYRLGFDPWALCLFLALMAPNFFWSAVPAPCDVLRGESATQALDSFASLCQVLSVGLMCLPLYKGQREKRAFGPWAKAALGCLCLYYLGWAFYYRGLAAFWVILLLTLPPCLALLSYILHRKNWPAALPAALFTVCHLVYAAVNFLLPPGLV